MFSFSLYLLHTTHIYSSYNLAVMVLVPHIKHTTGDKNSTTLFHNTIQAVARMKFRITTHFNYFFCYTDKHRLVTAAVAAGSCLLKVAERCAAALLSSFIRPPAEHTVNLNCSSRLLLHITQTSLIIIQYKTLYTTLLYSFS